MSSQEVFWAFYSIITAKHCEEVFNKVALNISKLCLLVSRICNVVPFKAILNFRTNRMGCTWRILIKAFPDQL